MAIDNPTHYKVLGTDAVTDLPVRRIWTPTDGITKEKPYAGPSDKIRAKFNELAALGTESSADQLVESINGKKGELLVRIFDDSGSTEGGNTEALNTSWELYGNQLLKPIESYRWFDAITPKRKREIEKAARDATALDAESPVQETRLYAYYSHNIMDYLSTDLLLRKSTVVTNKTTIAASYTRINTVVAMGTIDPPTAILGILTSLPRLGTTAGEWEWVKLAPQVRQIARKKYQLIYEWWGAERWASLYGGAWIVEDAGT